MNFHMKCHNGQSEKMEIIYRILLEMLLVVWLVDASSMNGPMSFGIPDVTGDGSSSTVSHLDVAAISQSNATNVLTIRETSQDVMAQQLSSLGTNAPESATSSTNEHISSTSVENAIVSSKSSNTQGISGGWFGKVLGKSNSNSNIQVKVADSKFTEASVTLSSTLPNCLPPPPPPPPLAVNGKDYQKQQDQVPAVSYKQQQEQQVSQTPNLNYNPSFSSALPNSMYPYNNNGPYFTTNPSHPNAYFHNPSNINNLPIAYQNLLRELDESTLREITLTHQLHNLSSHISTLTSESEHLISKIDILTERLADSTSEYNHVRNRNLELELNCTQWNQMVENLREEVSSYQSTVQQMEHEKKKKDEIVMELRSELRRVTDELERLACLVETERFEVEKGEYLRDLRMKQQALMMKRKKKQKNKWGFWSWFFGFDTTTSPSIQSVASDREQERLEEEERLHAAQELSRSTLLHALQTERANVDELEATVLMLQRNNSAIMDVIQSRDSLISELNDRVAIFEEDKMVLKAALRQLQNEMKEEGLKIDKTRKMERLLKEELEQLKIEYETENEEWRVLLEEGEKEWNQTKEELYFVSSYVDQLEGRLATFAIAKKEIEIREKQCEDIENKAKAQVKEAESWKSQSEVLAQEKIETKALLEDLVKERTEKSSKIDELLKQIQDLHDQIESSKHKVEEVEQQSENIKSQNARHFFLKMEEEKMKWEAETNQRIEELKRFWDVSKDKEWQQTLESEKSSWQISMANEFQKQFDQEKALWEKTLNNQKSELETIMLHEWNEKLSQQRMDLVAHFEKEMQHKLDIERLKWEELKDKEIDQMLTEERASWEASLPSTSQDLVYSSSLLDNEIERAASKIYLRLEQSGFTFENSPPSFDALTDLLRGSKISAHKSAVTSISDGVNRNTTPAIKAGAEQDHKYVHTNFIATNKSASSKSNSGLQNTTETKGHTKQYQLSARSVPFRTIRKAFSRATGLHGMITPSTAQLHQRFMPRRLTSKKTNKKIPPPPKDTLSLQDDDDTVESSLPPSSATDTEIENQIWDTVLEKDGENTLDYSPSNVEYYQNKESDWSYSPERNVELISIEPSLLPDHDIR